MMTTPSFLLYLFSTAPRRTRSFTTLTCLTLITCIVCVIRLDLGLAASPQEEEKAGRIAVSSILEIKPGTGAEAAVVEYNKWLQEEVDDQ